MLTPDFCRILSISMVVAPMRQHHTPPWSVAREPHQNGAQRTGLHDRDRTSANQSSTSPPTPGGWWGCLISAMYFARLIHKRNNRCQSVGSQHVAAFQGVPSARRLTRPAISSLSGIGRCGASSWHLAPFASHVSRVLLVQVGTQCG